MRGVLCERLYVREGFGVWVFRLRGFWCAFGGVLLDLV